MRWLARYAPVLAVGSLALAVVLAVLHERQTGFYVMSDFFDLSAYRAGARALLDGQELYRDSLVDGAVASFVYPPFAAALFVPLALLPAELAQAALLVVNVALLACAVSLCLRIIGHVDRTRATVALTAVLYWLEPVSWTIHLGQINLLLLVLVLVDFAGVARWPRGLGIGLATGIKLVPGVLVLYLLVTRRFRAAGVALAATAATVAVSLLISPADTVAYWRGAFGLAGRIGEVGVLMNESIHGLLDRALGQSNTALWLVFAVPVCVLGLLAAREAHRGGRELLGIAVCGMTGAAVSPMSWSHHWIWLLPLAIAALDVLEARWRPAVPVFAVLVFAWPTNFLTGHRMDVPALGVIGLPPWHGFEALYTNAYLVLLACALVLAVRSRQGVETVESSHSR